MPKIEQIPKPVSGGMLFIKVSSLHGVKKTPCLAWRFQRAEAKGVLSTSGVEDRNTLRPSCHGCPQGERRTGSGRDR